MTVCFLHPLAPGNFAGKTISAVCQGFNGHAKGQA
jgi:hypothetical protein